MNLKYTDFHDYGLPYAKTASAEDIMKNIEYLYQKMKQCTRNVTYFDLYKISTIITQDSEFESKINALEPYSTAIINTNITTAKETYSPGDMIVKNIDGTTSTIFAQRGGIFYPKSIAKVGDKDENYSYDISFAFHSSAPAVSSTDSDSDSDKNGVWEVDYAETLTFEGLKGGAPTSPYNEVIEKPISENGVITILVDIDESVDPIDPIVHAYVNNEEVYMDQEIQYDKNASQFTIKLYGTLCTKVVIK